MDLSIIIVNWNSREYLQRCIDSILATTHGIKFEIIVIDNASFDGCDEMLRRCYPQVRFVQSEKNLGFAKANNEAFRFSEGRNLLFLNPDTEIKEDAIETLLRHLQALPSAGALGAKLLNSDKTIQTSCVQAFPTIANQVLDSEALRTLFPTARIWGTRPLYEEDGNPTEVDAVSGACLMIRRSVFERIGKFSEDFFMYSEDVDLCFKVRKYGLINYFIPSAVITHHGGASSSQNKGNLFSSVMILESRWRFFRKTRPSWYCWLYRFAMFFGSIVRIGLVYFLWPLSRFKEGRSSMDFVLKKWTSRLRWALGGENRVRNY